MATSGASTVLSNFFPQVRLCMTKLTMLVCVLFTALLRLTLICLVCLCLAKPHPVLRLVINLKIFFAMTLTWKRALFSCINHLPMPCLCILSNLTSRRQPSWPALTSLWPPSRPAVTYLYIFVINFVLFCPRFRTLCSMIVSIVTLQTPLHGKWSMRSTKFPTNHTRVGLSIVCLHLCLMNYVHKLMLCYKPALSGPA